MMGNGEKNKNKVVMMEEREGPRCPMLSA